MKELIKKVIKNNEYLAANLKERSEKQINDYRKILVIVQTEDLFTAKDYEIVEEIVRTETPVDADANLDKIYTFLNEFNVRKLKQIANKKETALFDLKPQTTKKNEEIISNSKKNDRTQIIKEIIASVGYNYDELTMPLKLKLIAIKDLESLSKIAKYLKDNNSDVLNSFKLGNIYSLIYLLINSNLEIISEVINILKEKFNITVSSPEFTKIINTGTTIFSKVGLNNFKKNIEIFKTYNASLKKLIRDNISLLTTNPESLKKIITELEKRGANINLIFERFPILFVPKNILNQQNIIEYNLNILEMYGFDLELFFTEENPCYTLLCSLDLASKIDQFIEVGLNEYIHSLSSQAGTALKSLIIKRIYYAYKNNYEVWSNLEAQQKELNESVINVENSDFVFPKELTQTSISETPYIENKDYNKEISNNFLLINDQEIENIKSDYSIMLLIDEAYRLAIYTDAPMGILKRKTEYVFGTQVISRLKVFKVFKILTELKINEKEALLSAITHNSILEPHEYEFIKDSVARIGVDENYDRLLKTI